MQPSTLLLSSALCKPPQSTLNISHYCRIVLLVHTVLVLIWHNCSVPTNMHTHTHTFAVTYMHTTQKDKCSNHTMTLFVPTVCTETPANTHTPVSVQGLDHIRLVLHSESIHLSSTPFSLSFCIFSFSLWENNSEGFFLGGWRVHTVRTLPRITHTALSHTHTDCALPRTYTQVST